MGSQQIFCLRWSNHQMNMLTVFDRLLQSEALVDVTLACEGLSFRAHKMVLSACSPYFQSLFMENPCKHPIVILKDIKYCDLRALVDFMYKGEVNVNHDQLAALIKTAEVLKVKGLTEIMSANNANEKCISLKSANPPPPKRKKMRHHARISHQAVDNPPTVSKQVSIDDDNSLIIQGSPEMIEAKVDVPLLGIVADQVDDEKCMLGDVENEVSQGAIKEDKVEISKHTMNLVNNTPLNKNNNTNNVNKNEGNLCCESSSSFTDQRLTKPSTTSSSSKTDLQISSSGSDHFSCQAQCPVVSDALDTDDDSMDTPSLEHSVIGEFKTFSIRNQELVIPPVSQQLPSNYSNNESSNACNSKKGHPRILNEDEEKMIVRFVQDMAKLGKLVSRKCVIDYGNMLLRRHDRVPTGSIHCNPLKGLSNDWWKEFKKRNKGLPFCRHPASNT